MWSPRALWRHVFLRCFFEFGHTKPKMKMQKMWLNDVPLYGGIAAVDGYIGATEWRKAIP